MLGKVYVDTKAAKSCLSASVHLSFLPSIQSTTLQTHSILSSISSIVLETLSGKFHHYQQRNKFIFSSWWMNSIWSLNKWLISICSVNNCLSVIQPVDPLEGTDLPGIVFRLSSLTITKALIRLDSSSSAGSDGSLVLLLYLSLDTVRVRFVFWIFVLAAGGFQKAS